MSDVKIKSDSIYVIGYGAQTPVGKSALASAAAVRCGISAYAEHPFMVDQHGEPMVVARAPWLDESMPVPERVASLAAAAVSESLDCIQSQVAKLGGLSMHLALSEENLPQPEQRQVVIDRLNESTGGKAGSDIDVIVDGHAGGLLALERAASALREGKSPACLVGGADSWMEPGQLELIDEQGRLHSPNNSWGFTPGEGAGFCVITTGAVIERLGVQPVAEIMGVATGQESKLLGTKTVCIGEGLTTAFRGVLNSKYPVTHSYCDFNGETYRAEEYGFSVCRTRDGFEDAGSFTAPADCWGDVGAASGPLVMTLPLIAWARKYGKGQFNLVWSSSARSPLRAATLLMATIPLSAT
jgi:3-oxoacyl-[acyl-carrier-protein] synthase-1